MRVLGDGVAVELGQPEREAVEQLGRAMRVAVPLGVVRRRQPEVGAEIDEVRDRVDELRGELLRLPVREREEDEIELGERAGSNGTYSRPGYAAPSDG